VLDLDVAVSLTAAHAERLVDVVAAHGARGPELVGDRFEAFDLEPDVMDPAIAPTPLGASRLVVLEVEDRQVDVAVAQEAPPGAGIFDLRDLLHPEDLDVEPGGRFDVLRRERDVFDLGHGASPFRPERSGSRYDRAPGKTSVPDCDDRHRAR